MFEKIKALLLNNIIMKWFGNFNEAHYNIGYIALTGIVTLIATQFGFIPFEIVSGVLMKSSVYVASSVVFLKALMGPQIDVVKEVKEEHNLALAILIAGFLIGLGFACGGI
jgi:hypothetical protein